MTAQQVEAVASDKVEEVPRPGKTPFWRMGAASFKLKVPRPNGEGEIEVSYSGFVVWSSTLKEIILKQLIGKPAVYTFEPGQKQSFAPTATEVRLDGQVLYPTEEHKKSDPSLQRRSSSSSSRAPSWRDTEQGWRAQDAAINARAERERRSIEAQKAGEFATAIVTTVMPQGDWDEATATKAGELVATLTKGIALAIRQAATQTTDASGSGREEAQTSRSAGAGRTSK